MSEEVKALQAFLGKEKKRENVVETVLLENYDRYYRLAYSYTKNEADALDIVQNGTYKAIKNSSSLRNTEFAGTWIYRIMLNEIFRFYQKKGPVCVSLEDMPVEQGKEDIYEDIDLKEALDSLSAEDKAVIELRFFEECQLNEIAEILGENLSTVKSRLYRGMKKLKLQLTLNEE